MLVGVGIEFAQRGFADAALGGGDGAQESGVVVGVGQQADVGEYVFDFGFIKKALTA